MSWADQNPVGSGAWGEEKERTSPPVDATCGPASVSSEGVLRKVRLRMGWESYDICGTEESVGCVRESRVRV